MTRLDFPALTALLILAACTPKTEENISTPVNLMAVDITAQSITFKWDEVAGADSYEYRVSLKGGDEVSSGTTRITQKECRNLLEDTSYSFYVRAKGMDQMSDWAQTDAKTDKAAPGPEPGPEPESLKYEDFKIPATEDQHKEVLAFPGAEGGGMYTSGGRGGKVYHVTSLADSGDGTLRDAIENGQRPLTVVFDVAGLIHLKKDLKVSLGNITIAGQTAPGDGICVCDATVNIQSNNVIIRYVRFRLGDKGNDGKGGGLSDGSDAIWGRYNENIILDHCSMSWSVDEVASFYANKNFTMQWCNVSEAMNASLHDKGGHGYGGLWGGRNASFHHNLLSNNHSRNARIDHPGIYDKYLSTHRGNVDYRNNVIYNWGDNSTYGGEDGHYNIVGNYYKPGPASKDRKYFVDAYWYNSSSSVGSAYPELYIKDNVHSKYSDISTDNTKGIYYHDQSSYGTNPKGVVLSSPLSIRSNDTKDCYTTTHPAASAFEQVLSYVGACLRRDAVDARQCKDAKNGTATFPTGSNGSKGGIIDSQEDVGGWPEYSASAEEISRVKDTDKDGMPDWFEDMAGLNKSSAADAGTKTLDKNGRYTNLEMYLHYIVRDITAAQTSGGTYMKL